MFYVFISTVTVSDVNVSVHLFFRICLILAFNPQDLSLSQVSEDHYFIVQMCKLKKNGQDNDLFLLLLLSSYYQWLSSLLVFGKKS